MAQAPAAGFVGWPWRSCSSRLLRSSTAHAIPGPGLGFNNTCITIIGLITRTPVMLSPARHPCNMSAHAMWKGLLMRSFTRRARDCAPNVGWPSFFISQPRRGGLAKPRLTAWGGRAFPSQALKWRPTDCAAITPLQGSRPGKEQSLLPHPPRALAWALLGRPFGALGSIRRPVPSLRHCVDTQPLSPTSRWVSVCRAAWVTTRVAPTGLGDA